MTKIVVSAETEVWSTRDPDPSDSWDAGDTTGRVVGVRAWEERDWERSGHSRYGGYDSWSGDLDARAGDYVYAVVADYESGSTFGRDGGHASILDVFTDVKEADSLCIVAEKAKDFRFFYGDKEYYASWTGYFEYLQDMKVWAVRVEKL